MQRFLFQICGREETEKLQNHLMWEKRGHCSIAHFFPAKKKIFSNFYFYWHLLQDYIKASINVFSQFLLHLHTRPISPFGILINVFERYKQWDLPKVAFFFSCQRTLLLYNTLDAHIVNIFQNTQDIFDILALNVTGLPKNII